MKRNGKEWNGRRKRRAVKAARLNCSLLVLAAVFRLTVVRSAVSEEGLTVAVLCSGVGVRVCGGVDGASS